jgi:hypothetical protein
MDGKQWLRSRNPAPPDHLLNRMEAALSDSKGLSLSEEFLSAGARILESLTKNSGGIQRDTAIDLLAADALITYALEAASENCESFDPETRATLAAVAKIPIH